MSFFSGLISGAMPSMLANIPLDVAVAASGKPAGSRRGPLSRLGRAFDPSNLAMSQALLNGDYGAAGAMALRSRQLDAERAAQATQAAAAEQRFESQHRAMAPFLDKHVIAGMGPDDRSRYLLERFRPQRGDWGEGPSAAGVGQLSDAAASPAATTFQGGGPGPQPGLAPASAAAGPPPGTVINGYRFRGGNPFDPNAWAPAGR